MENFTEQKTTLGLYDPQFEHDACGIGAVVDIKGRKSHQTVDDALSIVERLEHRAGKDAEGKTGDGVGILLQISHKFFSKVAEELNIRLGNEREYGVGMFFFPQNEHLRAQAMKLFEVVTRKEGLEFLAWREVPVDPDAVGQKARDCMPAIWQCFIKKPAKVSKGIEFDRRLYIVRRVFEQASNGTYVPSLSSRTIVYKGMFLVQTCAASMLTCRTRIMNPPSVWCTAAFLPTPTPAGCVHTPTALSCTTARSIPSRATPTPCWRVRRAFPAPFCRTT